MIYFANKEVEAQYRQHHDSLMIESDPIREDGHTLAIESSVRKSFPIRSKYGYAEYFEKYYITYRFITDAPPEYVDIMRESVISKWGRRWRGFDIRRTVNDNGEILISIWRSYVIHGEDSYSVLEKEKDRFDELPEVMLNKQK